MQVPTDVKSPPVRDLERGNTEGVAGSEEAVDDDCRSRAGKRLPLAAPDKHRCIP
jgi:hypothetical protein